MWLYQDSSRRRRRARTAGEEREHWFRWGSSCCRPCRRHRAHGPRPGKEKMAALVEEWSARAHVPLSTHTYLHPCCRHSQPWHFLALGTTVTRHLGSRSLLFNFAVLQKKWNGNWLRKMDLRIAWPQSGKELILQCACGNLIFYRS